MRSLHIMLICCLATAAICFVSNAAIAEVHHHAGDWAFGIENGDASVIEPEADEILPIHLSPFTAGLFNGDWGVEFWNLPNPDLSAVRVLFLSAPTGLTLYHGGTLILGDDGETTGQGYFDMAFPEPGIHHAHIDAYANTAGTYSIDFKLVHALDANGLMIGDSDVYQVDFQTVPEPSGLIALAVPIIGLLIRKRM